MSTHPVPGTPAPAPARWAAAMAALRGLGMRRCIRLCIRLCGHPGQVRHPDGGFPFGALTGLDAWR